MKGIHKMNWADATDYPKLFGQTYWGSSSCKTEHPHPVIITNRNLFAVTYGLKRINTAYSVDCLFIEHRSGFLDHVEIYRTIGDGFVFLTSPYGREIIIPDQFRRFGFKKYLPLYTFATESFVSQIELPRKYLFQWYKSCFESGNP